MKWATFNHPWRKRFAIIPVGVSTGPTTEYVWLEWCWRRWFGDCYEVSFTDPALTAALAWD